MADEEINSPQDGDDVFPSFLKAPVENKDEEYEYEYIELPEDEVSAVSDEEELPVGESGELLEEENEFNLDDMLSDISDDLDLAVDTEDGSPLSADVGDGREALALSSSLQNISSEEQPVLISETETVADIIPEAVEKDEEVVEPAADLVDVLSDGETDRLSVQEAGSDFPEVQNASVQTAERDESLETSETTAVEAEDKFEPIEPDSSEAAAVSEERTEPADISLQQDGAFLLLPDSGIQAIELSAYDGNLRIVPSLIPGGNSWFWLERRQHLAEISSGGAGLDIRQPVPGANFVTLVKGGDQKLELFNRTHLQMENVDTQAFEAVDGDFILGNAGFDSGAVIEEFSAVNPADLPQTEIFFAEPAAGIISGPGAVAFVNGLRCLQWSFTEAENYEKEQLRCLKFYSGSLGDKYFELSGNSPAAEFAGNEEINSIHVNCGASTYGWNVSFENGVAMSLRDLREYQVRYGKMPDNAGIISCGELHVPFNNIVRIVVYESAQYFSYR